MIFAATARYEDAIAMPCHAMRASAPSKDDVAKDASALIHICYALRAGAID